MTHETSCRQQTQAFLLRLMWSDDEDYQLLLRPIDGDTYVVFADMASLFTTLSKLTTSKNELAKKAAAPARLDEKGDPHEIASIIPR